MHKDANISSGFVVIIDNGGGFKIQSLYCSEHLSQYWFIIRVAKAAIRRRIPKISQPFPRMRKKVPPRRKKSGFRNGKPPWHSIHIFNCTEARSY